MNHCLWCDPEKELDLKPGNSFYLCSKHNKRLLQMIKATKKEEASQYVTMKQKCTCCPIHDPHFPLNYGSK